MVSDRPVPLWLWRLATGGLAVALAAVLGLAVALTRGLADSPRAGPLVWQDDFKAASGRWEFVWPDAAAGCALEPRHGALEAEFFEGSSCQWVIAVTERPAASFTLEVAGAQTAGALGIKYGLVLGWRDAAHYSAVLVNGNGYVEAYTVNGAERREWFAWQQWPNLLVGTESNRLRADVRGADLRGAEVQLRINDELLLTTTADVAGRVGVMAADSAAPGRVVFSWVKAWGR